MKTNISKQLQEILKNYSDEVVEVTTRTLSEVGDHAVERLHTAGDFRNRSGKYRRSFTKTTEEGRTFTGVIVHARPPHHRLTHLLENGHRVGKTDKRTRAYPHISIVNDEAQDEAVKKIIEAIESLNN